MNVKGEITERYEVTSEPTGTIGKSRCVGVAYKKETNASYTLYLNLLQGVRLLIVPMFNDETKFKVFAQTTKWKPKNLSLRSCVGSGEITESGSHIRLWVPDLRQYYYVNLDPRAYHYNYSAA